MSQKILSSLFAQKAWANRELFDVLASIEPAENAACVHTAIRTLNHIYVVDRIFCAHLLGEKHPSRRQTHPRRPNSVSFTWQSLKPTNGLRILSPALATRP